MRTWGKENLLITYFTVLSLGPIQGTQSFTANGLSVTFPGSQGLAANVEPYKDKMWMQYRDGLPSDTSFSLPSLSVGSPAMSPAWTSAHKFSGYAASMWTMQNNSKRASYENGVPRPLWTIHGMKLWDPRFDSTYPGGSGSQRRDNWMTWAYTENPYVHALAWVRGHHKNLTTGLIDRSKRLAGVGAPDDAIDIAAFVEGANIADANTWKIAGEWTTADDKWNVLAAMLQAGGGLPLNRGAQISCMVNAPRASLMTLTGADLAGPVSLKVMSSRRDRFNTIIPRYRDESQKWEEVAAGPVTSSTYVTEDRGEPRTREVSYVYVRQAKQAAELGAYDLANARESLTGTLPSKPYLLNLRAGDAFTVAEPELGLNGQKFLVLRRGFDPGTAVVTLEVRSETDAKHAWALGQAANPPPSPSLTALDQTPDAPGSGEWAVTARPADTDGTQQPGLILTGAVASDNIGTVLVEYATSTSGPWEQAYTGPPTTTTVAIDGLKPGQAYYVGITYISLKGTPSVRTIKGPITAPGLTSGGIVNQGDLATQNEVNANQIPTLESLNAIADDAFETPLWTLAGGATVITSAEATGAPLYARRAVKSPVGNGTTVSGYSSTFAATPQTPVGKRIPVTGDSTYRFRAKALYKNGFTGLLRYICYYWAADGTSLGNTQGLFKDCRTSAQSGDQLITVDYQQKMPANAASMSVTFYLLWSTTLPQAGYVVVAKPWASNSVWTQYIDSEGRITDSRGLPLNVGNGAAVVLSPAVILSPGSPAHTAVSIAASTATLVGYSLSLPSGSISGLAADTQYGVFRDVVANAYIALSTGLTPYFTNPSRYLFMGYQRTAVNSGGGYSPPAPPPPGGGGGYCPDEDTPILMADGSTKRAGDLVVGDFVQTMHEVSLEWVAAQVYGVAPTGAPRSCLALSDGRQLIATPGHRVHVQGKGFTALRDLVFGDVLSGDEARTVEAVTPLAPGRVVRISVMGAQTYITNGVLSHNLKPIGDL